MLKKINLLALVPGAPIVQGGDKITDRSKGQRLFAIGRTSNVDYNRTSKEGLTEEGRYTILFTPDGSSATAPWISETEAQAILNQIKDFNPEKQPLAFQDLISKNSNDKNSQLVQKYNETQQNRNTSDLSNNIQNEHKQNNNGIHGETTVGYWLLAFGVIFLITLFIWIKIGNQTSNKK